MTMTKKRLSELGLRAGILLGHARDSDPVEINIIRRRVSGEMKELLEVYPHIVDALECRFRQEQHRAPDECPRVEELIAFACTHRLERNGECYRGP
jgi:hypothetical protein